MKRCFVNEIMILPLVQSLSRSRVSRPIVAHRAWAIACGMADGAACKSEARRVASILPWPR